MPFTPSSNNTLEVQVRSDGVQGFRGQMDDAISAVYGFKGAIGAAGGALAAFSAGSLAAAAGAAADFQEAMVEVEKVTDPSTAAAMRGEIKDMATDIPLAQEELAALTADAARFGVRGTENIRSFTETVARMATATNLSTSEAGSAMAKLSELTNTPISEMENLGSSINSLSNNFATSSQEIVDNMLRGSAALQQLGLNQREMAGLATATNEVSASARRAGTRLRRVAQELMDPKKVEKLSSAFGMSAEEFKNMRDNDPVGLIRMLAKNLAEGTDKADAIRSSLSTVSRQALAGLGNNLEGLDQALKTSNSSFEEATSLQREFDAATDTFNSKVKLMTNRLRNNAIEIGTVLLPHLTDLVETVNRFLSSGDSLLNQLSAQEKAIGLVAIGVLGLAAAAAMFVSGPLGLLIAGAGAVAAAYKNNFLGIKDDVDQTFSAISSLWETHSGPLMTEVRKWQEKFRRFWSKWGDEITAVAEFAWDAIRFIVVTAVDGILSSIRTVLALLRGDWRTALKAAAGFWERTFGRLGVDVSGIKESVNEALGLPFEATIGKVRVGGETVFPGETLRIPALAEGGIVTSPTLAMVGESGDEAVVPLNRLKSAFEGVGGDIMVTVKFEGESVLVEEARRQAKVVVDRKEDSRADRVERLETRSSVE